MQFTLLAFAGLAAAAPALQARQSYYSYNLTGAYWDATITTQSGRPGYTIRDLEVSFHDPLSEKITPGTCHYSFVPQGWNPPATTSTCDAGLTYNWDTKSLSLIHKVTISNETVTLYGNAALTSACKTDGVGSGSTCVAKGRIELGHYCRLDPVVVGCYPVDGNPCGDQCGN